MARTDQWEVQDPGTHDRLSLLPDEIITHILSLLETMYAVRTTVLSRRWKDLWTRVSNLDFDYENWAPNQVQDDMEEMRELEFYRFVNWVLSQHKNLDSLLRFRLHFAVREYERKVWPDFGVVRKFVFGSQVEEIDVKFEWGAPFGISRRLPEGFYTLNNLKVVKLQGVIMTAKGSVSLPSVKVLRLYLVETKDFESLSRLIAGCPGLETLYLHYCYSLVVKKKDMLIASLPTLRNLTIISCGDGPGYDKWLCPIVIESPNLEHLHIEEFAELHILGSSPLSYLHSAWIDSGERQRSSYHYSLMIGLLTHVSNAKEMSLYWPTLVIKIFLSSQTTLFPFLFVDTELVC